MNVRKILLGLIPEKARLDRISKGIAKRHHRHVTEIAQSYLEGIKQRHLSLIELSPKKEDLVGKKIIWQYWGQGIESEKLPAVVQLCFDSVTQYSEEYEVIRLTDTNINEYVDLDHSVWERYIKYKDAGYKAAFFSDVLRVALLSCYGGIWLDATVLMTGSIPQECTSLPFFAYQRDNNQKHRSKWQKRTPTYFGWGKDFKVRFLSSIMFTMQAQLPK